VINGCENVKLQRLKIMAAGKSPNTDGIHVQQSNNIEITHSTIGTGDDCISIGAGTTNLAIHKILCGPGHGIRYLFLHYLLF
jgi:polygalacturonase